mgnify:CR=1 FL=1
MSERTSPAPALLEEVERLRSRVRANQRASSVPLLVLAALVVVSWMLPLYGAGPLLIVPAVAALLGIGVYYQRRQRLLGVGTSPHRWTKAGLVVFGVYVLVPWLAMLFLPPVAVVGAVVAALGAKSRNPALIAGGGAAALISALERWHLISNRFWDLGKLVDASPHTWWVANAKHIVLATLAATLLAVGLLALHRERRCD